MMENPAVGREHLHREVFRCWDHALPVVISGFHDRSSFENKNETWMIYEWLIYCETSSKQQQQFLEYKGKYAFATFRGTPNY